MKRKWWIALAAMVSGLLLCLCFFGIRLRLAPRLILSRALDAVVAKLEDRFEDSPVHLVSAAIDPGGCQRASVQLVTEQALLGIVRYDMQLCTQLSPCRIQADGVVVTGGKALDLSLYLDGDFAAVSSQSLVEGSYYGITYDTFPKDIRSRQFLAALIGESTISQWERSLSDLDRALSREWKLPELRTEDIVSALYGVLALKPQVSRVSTPAGASQYAHAVTFRASGQDIFLAAEPYRHEIPQELMHWLEAMNKDPDADIRVEFLLHKGNLVQIQGELGSAQGKTLVSLVLGADPEKEQLRLEIFSRAEVDRSIRVEIDTASDEETYQEQLSITQTCNRVRSGLSLAYVFDLSTGEMDLTILRDGDKAELRMNLSGDEDMLTIVSQNIAPFLNLFLESSLENPVICTLTVSPGREVAVPEYRNLDQWSLEDLFALLTGFGELIGLKLP